jgi:hypothetical protein
VVALAVAVLVVAALVKPLALLVKAQMQGLDQQTTRK